MAGSDWRKGAQNSIQISGLPCERQELKHLNHRLLFPGVEINNKCDLKLSRHWISGTLMWSRISQAATPMLHPTPEIFTEYLFCTKYIKPRWGSGNTATSGTPSLMEMHAALHHPRPRQSTCNCCCWEEGWRGLGSSCAPQPILLKGMGLYLPAGLISLTKSL